ncbi:hypothetical protein BCV69DRAFT_251089 [Microstroma glucosiphilum]|uniref:Uncharacterized protein n=1 Tax=Pseudomicrostroma glucosiphilum TaxID=1684307 RepID=A0A316U1Y4_9BASI|nr:hypothetical protein BCV69DRAFT_251089 [Pseudomicrostroma glucosiphilum]PWN19372.1 hypothetical protein BCV69DRAFT_251089 [Pseudomicrostroma glucosiphilum]
MRNGSPMFTLLSGYIGSIIFGTIMVFVAFDERSSKVMYLIHAPLWLIVFWFAEGFLVKLQVFATVSGSIVLWFVFQCRLLRFYILFLGLMSILYVVWDTLDDILYRKQNESDSGLLSRLVPGSRPISEQRR